MDIFRMILSVQKHLRSVIQPAVSQIGGGIITDKQYFALQRPVDTLRVLET